MSFMSFEADASRVPDLKSVGLQLQRHIHELYPSAQLNWNANLKKWVSSPNFVTIKFQPRVQTIRMTVTGEPNKHQEINKIQLVKDQNGYSGFVVESPDQLEEAKRIIARACKLKLMG